MNRGGRVEPTPPECALAAEMFDHFCSAGTMKQILALHREICTTLTMKPNKLPDFYPKLKAKLASSWKAQALFKKFDARASHKVYGKGRVGTATKVLIIGAGPCGLRAAIECQLLGAKVVVIEKRDRMSRNNVLHLWPFVITDLRALGAKKFFGKFCAGSIDHISIRQLQCILLKVALLLGVEFHEHVSFEELLEPTVMENSETLGWRARVAPADHPVAQLQFDVLLGADGKRNTLHGFKRTEFRGKLAMAITANFINRHSEQEASVPEISGVAFIFNQKFFKDLYEVTGIDLENIVYYKDDTHYFVMTAKKHSLLDKGVLLNDYGEVSRLLSVDNVDRAALMRYAQEAARFSTDGRLPLRDFALNHYGEPDVALFDFTSMYAAENASMVYERHGRRLLCQLVGDSLLEPFWPTGSGCARGFLSALDAAWAVRAWGQTPAPHPLEVIAERESIYRLLAQTTPENLHRDFGAYTLDPGTRYPNLNRGKVSAHQAASFYNTDDPLPLDATPSARKRRREMEVSDETLVSWVGSDEPGLRAAAAPPALADLLRRYRPDLLPIAASPRAVYHILQSEFGITPFSSGGTLRDVPDAKLRSYLARVYGAFRGEVPHVQHDTDVFHQIKQSQQKEKHLRNAIEHTPAIYASAADTDKSHSSLRKKRRSVRPQVSSDQAEYIRNKVAKLDINDISHLSRLIEGHDALNEGQNDKQKRLQEEIVALFDPDESLDPSVLRESLALLLDSTHTKVDPKVMQAQAKLAHFFEGTEQPRPVKPPRRLKGLDAVSMKVPDYSEFFDEYAVSDATTIVAPRSEADQPKENEWKSSDYEIKNKSPLSSEVRKLYGPTHELQRSFERSHSIPVVSHTKCRETKYKRSNSIDCLENVNARGLITMFEGYKRKHPPTTEKLSRSGSDSTLNVTVTRPISDILERKTKRNECIGTPEMADRKRRVSELIGEVKRSRSPKPKPQPKRKSVDIACRMQRMMDLVQKSTAKANPVSSRSHGKRKAAREIMRQRYERSLQMLATEPRLDAAPSSSADLDLDYGLQQYRASSPHFGERVKTLEKQLQHYEEGRVVGGGGRTSGGGVRVAQLAAELSGTPQAVPSAPRASKPKDLMRSVGKIERDDWNVKEIERKIMENRMGRPEPRAAERVPKWDREQFLGRQRRLKEGEGGEEKWGEIDETLHKLDQKLRDSGRPVHGTKKVANLATKFVKKDEPESIKTQPKEKEELKKSWRGPASTGVQCAACGTRVFAAEGVAADGLHLHRACFRCAVCKAVLRPGNYTMERNGCRLVCLRHGGASVPDAGAGRPPLPTPERISVELSDSGAREIDEDEWTDRNFLASETSGAGGLSDEEESSSDEYTDADDSDAARRSPEPARARLREARPPHSLYFSDDSFGYDDYSDDGAESSGNESCSRMRAAREARRREVPADARPPTDSSEVESGEESSSRDAVSSATEVSTDSEFAREECAPAPSPPAILVTEAPPPAPPPPRDYPLSRTRSAGGIATKRALELKTRYLLGEPSPPAVRKSDSTSQLDTKLEAFRSNITEFQKMLHPAPVASAQPHKPSVTFQFITAEKKAQPMPDIIKNLCSDAPVDLLTKVDAQCKKDWRGDAIKEEKKEPEELESDSLSDNDSSHTETAPNPSVPRVEVHNEGGQLIQLDSLMLIDSCTEDNDDKASGTATTTGPTAVAAESESSESCRDATTLALTETELSDWAAESAVLDDCNFDDDKKRNKNPRTLSGPKVIHDAKNMSAISNHVCGRTSPTEPVVYSNALEHFEFVDEGDQDPSIETPLTPRNEGYMELVDDEYDPYSPSNDRSMNFIESVSDTVVMPASHAASVVATSPNKHIETEYSKDSIVDESPQIIQFIEMEASETSDSVQKSDTVIKNVENSGKIEDTIAEFKDTLSLSDISPPLEKDFVEPKPEPIIVEPTAPIEDTSPPLAPETPKSIDSTNNPIPMRFSTPCTIRLYSPAICRSASETFNRSTSRSTDSPARSMEWSASLNLSSGSVSPVSPAPPRDTADKQQEIKREREEQTEVVRRLVLERLGSGPRVPRKSTRRTRISPSSSVPPPVPPPPTLPTPPPPPPPPVVLAPPLVIPPPPPRPAPPLMPLPVTPSFSDPELARERRRKSIMKSISNYLNRRLGPRQKVSSPQQAPLSNAHKSTGALQEPPPVPPPPAGYCPPAGARATQARMPGGSGGGAADVDERDAMQLWFEARWARLMAQRRARDETAEPHARRVARLERRLTRPLSAEQQAATVAELVQVSAQREAHQALMAADRRRNGGVAD